MHSVVHSTCLFYTLVWTDKSENLTKFSCQTFYWLVVFFLSLSFLLSLLLSFHNATAGLLQSIRFSVSLYFFWSSPFTHTLWIYPSIPFLFGGLSPSEISQTHLPEIRLTLTFWPLFVYSPSSYFTANVWSDTKTSKWCFHLRFVAKMYVAYSHIC